MTDKGFVGRMQEADALIGIVMEDGEVLAYVCDAFEGGESRSGWYEGLPIDGTIEMTPVIGTTYEGTSFGSKITATLTGDVIEGALELEDGTQFPFTAELASPKTAAGLYVDEDEEDDSLISVVVSNDEEVKGLSRFRRTGWTRRVVPSGRLSRTERINVNLIRSTGSRLSRTINVRRRPPAIRPRIRPRPDPAPTGGSGTLMIMTSVVNQRVVGHHYIAERPDKIGVATIKRSAQLIRLPQTFRFGRVIRAGRPRGALHSYMRVRVLDKSGRVLSGQFIDDPLSPFVEVPLGRGPEGYNYWANVAQTTTSFLVAVPDIKDARRVLFTRFTATDGVIHSGVVDLNAEAVKKPRLRAQVAGDYEAADAEHLTIVDNGAPENRFDLLILAEGYQDTNADRFAFYQHANDVINYLWTIPIYAEYQAAINVHTAYLPSVDSGNRPWPTCVRITSTRR